MIYQISHTRYGLAASRPASHLPAGGFCLKELHEMRICIYGAGAIGGYLGVLLSRAGAEVSLVARGAHLEAMQRSGLKLLIDHKEYVAHPHCTNDPAELGPQDLVVIGVRAPSAPAIVPAMRPLIGNETALLTAVNGIPYWYFYAHGGEWEDSIVESGEPDRVP